VRRSKRNDHIGNPGPNRPQRVADMVAGSCNATITPPPYLVVPDVGAWPSRWLYTGCASRFSVLHNIECALPSRTRCTINGYAQSVPGLPRFVKTFCAFSQQAGLLGGKSALRIKPFRGQDRKLYKLL
jgi:hypothetical protein